MEDIETMLFRQRLRIQNLHQVNFSLTPLDLNLAIFYELFIIKEGGGLHILGMAIGRNSFKLKTTTYLCLILLPLIALPKHMQITLVDTLTLIL